MAGWISIFPLHGSGQFVVLTDVSRQQNSELAARRQQQAANTAAAHGKDDPQRTA